ncbi:MAG: CBS domain-containing protein [Proteobacteria bacterium]|nr:CBS domain-containing protein [Pseudomonadota bacterium]
MTTTLKQLLSNRHQPPAAVNPDDTVFHALQVMADNNIGAVLVLDGKRLVGIFSERDYARKVILLGKASRDTKVREIMTDKVLCVTLSHTVEECMAIMSNRHFRHLPVLDGGGELAGIVSIGDLVAETIREQKLAIEQLERYIVSDYGMTQSPD